MTSLVTLDIYSGRPNPSWLLPQREEQQLLSRLKALNEPTDKRPSGSFGGLGYRGFFITRDIASPRGPISMRIHEGILDHQLGGTNLVADSTLETWLAETGRSHLSDVVYEYVRTSIAKKTIFRFAREEQLGTCPSCNAADAPLTILAHGIFHWSKHPIIAIIMRMTKLRILSLSLET